MHGPFASAGPLIRVPDLYMTPALSFLQVYGTLGFDTRRFCVSLSPAGPLMPLGPPWVPKVGTSAFFNPAPPVVILDPINTQNNLGRSCFGFRQLQLC